MMTNLEMLTAREQLMWDIDGIVEEFFVSTWGDEYGEDMEELIKDYLHTKMMTNLEMLTAREQLMWDIDGIVEEFACNIVPRISEDDMEDLIKTLCDSVCKNFPSK